MTKAATFCLWLFFPLLIYALVKVDEAEPIDHFAIALIVAVSIDAAIFCLIMAIQVVA